MSRRRTNVRQYSAEDQALTDISKEAENRLAAKRAARAEAREIRTKEIERQEKEAEEKERLGSDHGAAKTRGQQSATSAASSRRGSDSSEETNDSMSSSTRNVKMELRTLEEKYKAAMMTSAQLDNEKQSLVYQVEMLKDQLEELTETHTELQREYKEKNRNLELTKRELQAAQLDMKGLREQNDYKDRLIAESGFVIVASENGEISLERSSEPPSANGPIGTGGLLLSSESLVLLNKGREGSLGMHSLDFFDSATHTTQVGTGQSQPLSHTQKEGSQSGSTETVTTTGHDEEGSSVDGPIFLKSSKDRETGSRSSSGEADEAEIDVFAEAVESLSEQPGAADSHSPDDMESGKSVQEARGSVSAGSDAAGSVSSQVVGEHVCDLIASHEDMGSESTEKSADSMLTYLHEHEDDCCKDKGRKVSDDAGISEQTSAEISYAVGVDQIDSSTDASQCLTGTKAHSAASQSGLPSVVVTDCSHSQQNLEEDDDVEFFDAVSTPIPSPKDTEFQYGETGAGTQGQAAGTAASENSEEVPGEGGKEVAKEEGEKVDEDWGEEADGLTEDVVKEVDGKDYKEAYAEEDKVTSDKEEKEGGEGDKHGGREISPQVTEDDNIVQECDKITAHSKILQMQGLEDIGSEGQEAKLEAHEMEANQSSTDNLAEHNESSEELSELPCIDEKAGGESAEQVDVSTSEHVLVLEVGGTETESDDTLGQGEVSEKISDVQQVEGTEKMPDPGANANDSAHVEKSVSDNKEPTSVTTDEGHLALSNAEAVNSQSTSKQETELAESQEGSVSEQDSAQTRPLSEAENDDSVTTEPQDSKLSLEDYEDSVLKSIETASEPTIKAEPAHDDDISKTAAEDAVIDINEPDVKEGPADKNNEDLEETPDTLSPMLDSRKPINQEISEGGTSEDSEAQLNDDTYDFDDIDAVLDEGSPVASTRKDSEQNLDGDADDKVSFGSKDSGLQSESYTNKDIEANKEDTVSFGSRDSGLQESTVNKEGEMGSGDTVSLRSRDSGAEIEDIPQSLIKSGEMPEGGAVGGASAHHPVAGSRESLDLEAKLDKLVQQESATKETPSKDKHSHKKSKKFKMFKKIFH